MSDPPRQETIPGLPGDDKIRRAVHIYLKVAYPDGWPESVGRLLPPDGAFDPAAWLMGGPAERPPGAAADVRSFALRLGNRHYPHMKLRLARPPRDGGFLFMVDSHDAMLRNHARPEDLPAVESLNRQNAAIAKAIIDAWAAAGLPTERSYLREKIRQGVSDNG